VVSPPRSGRAGGGTKTCGHSCPSIYGKEWSGNFKMPQLLLLRKSISLIAIGILCFFAMLSISNNRLSKISDEKGIGYAKGCAHGMVSENTFDDRNYIAITY
jgi:hypothetical protein